MVSRPSPDHWKKRRQQAQEAQRDRGVGSVRQPDFSGYGRNDTGHKDPRKTRQWLKLKQLLLPYGAVNTCHICGHPTWNEGTLDHLVPFTEKPELGLVASNLRPAHHKPCPICSEMAGEDIRCNAIRGGYSVERAQRIIRQRTGAVNEPEPEGRIF